MKWVTVPRVGWHWRVSLVSAGLCTACGGEALKTSGEPAGDATPDAPDADPPDADPADADPADADPADADPPDPLTRASRFDYESECVARQTIRLWDDPSVRVVQQEPVTLNWMECGAIEESDEAAACWDSLVACEETEPELDSSQWPEKSTVYKIVGVDPEQINVRRTNLGTTEVYNSGYYDDYWQSLPPGCNPNIDCSPWWYLDVMDEGIALVACPAMVANDPDYLPIVTLSLCLVE